MSQVQRHYDDLLAAHYSWMNGMSFCDKVAQQRKLLEDLGFQTGSAGMAIDLGCGPGYQAAALSDLGYDPVIAMDTSQALLDEMSTACRDRPVSPILADLRDLPALVEQNSAAAIMCMGDTLTHLESHADVATLLRDACRTLRSGGRLVLTFRDYSVELTGTDRFIPVRSDGGWTLHKSSYRKLRLAPSSVIDDLRQAGLSIAFDAPVDRMRIIVACKP